MFMGCARALTVLIVVVSEAPAAPFVRCIAVTGLRHETAVSRRDASE
jgi:hypothetical protein